MGLERNKYSLGSVICAVSILLLFSGCGNGPEYRYQSAADATKVAKGQEGSSIKRVVRDTSEGTGAAAGEGETAAAAEPELPKATVGEILRNDKPFLNRNIVVIGRMGKVMPHYNMGFILNADSESYIEFSYGQMEDSDRFALARLQRMQKLSLSGTWDSTRKIFVADGVVPTSQ